MAVEATHNRLPKRVSGRLWGTVYALEEMMEAHPGRSYLTAFGVLSTISFAAIAGGLDSGVFFRNATWVGGALTLGINILPVGGSLVGRAISLSIAEQEVRGIEILIPAQGRARPDSQAHPDLFSGPKYR